MAMFYVYILYSEIAKKSYVGYSNNLERRLWEHNNSPKKSFTSKFRPWTIIYREEYPTKKEAMSREKWFKTGIGRQLKETIISDYLNKNI